MSDITAHGFATGFARPRLRLMLVARLRGYLVQRRQAGILRHVDERLRVDAGLPCDPGARPEPFGFVVLARRHSPPG